MSDNRWEPLTTPEAVVEAIKAGRRVEFTAGKLSDTGWIPAGKDDVVYEEHAKSLLGFGRFRALIEPAQPAADAGPGGTVAPEDVAGDGDLPGMWAHTDTVARDEVRGPAIPPGYKPWHGGECPKDVVGKKTRAILRGGETRDFQDGANLRWWHLPEFLLGSYDIIAYCVDEPARAVAPKADAPALDASGEPIALREKLRSAEKALADAERRIAQMEADVPAEPAEVEALAEIVYEAMRFDREDAVPKWVAGGNSIAQDTARATATRLARRLRPVVVDEAMVERVAISMAGVWTAAPWEGFSLADKVRWRRRAADALSPEGRSDGQ